MNRLTLSNIGPIDQADLTLGDLTLLIGPQATGKSIALQFLKLVVDAAQIQQELRLHGLDWSGRLPEFFDIYFGEGMRSIWREKNSAVTWAGRPVDVGRLIARRRRPADETLAFIPAQRVLTLRDGWPRPFTDYSPGDPFAVRAFSERLRLLVESDLGANENLFPQKHRLKRELREPLEQSVFGGFGLHVDKSRVQKRLVLGMPGDRQGAAVNLPFMVWSAGQREFVPLLLGLYQLLPRTKRSRSGAIRWVVLEELEMGLHPRAINVLLLMVLDLLARGYRVCLSTHTPQVLEAVWAMRQLKRHGGSASDVLELFSANRTQPMLRLAESALKITSKIHYFDPLTRCTQDISDLDLTGGNQATWGGLIESSERANAIVARVAAQGARQ